MIAIDSSITNISKSSSPSLYYRDRKTDEEFRLASNIFEMSAQDLLSLFKNIGN